MELLCSNSEGNEFSFTCTLAANTYTLCFAGLLSDPSDSSDMANSVQDSNGLCFIPAFSGIQVN
jgi:hypothetical protein